MKRYHSTKTKKKISKILKKIGAGKWNKGRKQSPKSIQKRNQTRKLRGWIVWNKDKTGIFDRKTLKKISESSRKRWQNPEFREKMIKKHQGKPSWNKNKKMPQTSKERHWNWKGGITALDKIIRNSLLYRQWRMAIFERDNWTCQFCWERGGRLVAHHLKPLSQIIEENLLVILEEGIEKCDELWDLDNGITLCEGCHSLTDTYLNRWGKKS